MIKTTEKIFDVLANLARIMLYQDYHPENLATAKLHVHEEENIKE